MAVDSANKDSSLLRDATITGLVETAESVDEFSNMEKGTFSSEDNRIILVCSRSSTAVSCLITSIVLKETTF